MITYPPQIRKDKDKLFACYSLVQQMIDEHNRQGGIAKANRKAYIDSGKFKAYQNQVFEPRLKQILAERNRLVEAIRRANYTPEEWKAVGELDMQKQDTIHETLFGDKMAAQVKPTFATSPVLDELKTIGLDSLTPVKGADPTQDFTSATWNNGTPQADPNSRYTITSSKVQVTGQRNDEDNYFYADFGANHFDGDFEHLLEGYFDAASGYPLGVFWKLSNTADDNTLANDAIIAFFYYAGSDLERIYLREKYDGNNYQDYWDCNFDTLYYMTIERDEGVGTYGTAYIYIYSDSERETLITTLSVVLHAKQDLRYLYAAHSYNDGQSHTMTYYIQNLDLQEAEGWTNISHVKGVAAASISHIKGVAVADISHIKGVAV